MDQCMNCTVRGDLDACMETPCSQHESWYAQTLKAQRTWEGLSIFEINDLVQSTPYDEYHCLVEKTEALLKEKNT